VISLEGLIRLVVYLIAAGLICYLLWWLIEFVNPPEPFRKVATVLVAVVAVVAAVSALLWFAGVPVFRP
jgi:hypothetical protein